jgi:hypothetical protein
VQEVSNKMQLHLDAVVRGTKTSPSWPSSTRHPGSTPSPLAPHSTRFGPGSRLRPNPNHPTREIRRALTWLVCHVGQEGIRRGVDLLRCCDEMVSKLNLVSSNESKEDVSTTNLKYLLVCPLSFSCVYIYSVFLYIFSIQYL